SNPNSAPVVAAPPPTSIPSESAPIPPPIPPLSPPLSPQTPPFFSKRHKKRGRPEGRPRTADRLLPDEHRDGDAYGLASRSVRGQGVGRVRDRLHHQCAVGR